MSAPHHAAPKLSSRPRATRLALRLAVFAAFVALFAAGSLLPMPGLDPVRLGETWQAIASSSGLARFELALANVLSGGNFLGATALALAVTPLASAAAGTRLFVPARAGRPIRGWLPALAVLACAVQALGLAMWLQNQPGVVVAPGPAATALMVLVLTSGAAVVAYGAKKVGDSGLGSGVGFAVLAAVLVGLVAESLAPRAGAVRPEILQLAAFAAVAAAGMGASAALVARYRRKQSRTLAEFERDVRRGRGLGTAALALALLVSGAPKGVENLADVPAAEVRSRKRKEAGDDPEPRP